MDLVTTISLIVLLAALLLPVLAQLLRRHPRWFAAAKYIIFGVYILANLYETLLFRGVRANYQAEWFRLWSYRESLAFPDGLKSLFLGTVEVTRPALLEEIILNIFLYIPMGYLLPSVFEKLKPWHVLLTGFVCSAHGGQPASFQDWFV